jgi:hypothetical protein
MGKWMVVNYREILGNLDEKIEVYGELVGLEKLEKLAEGFESCLED